MLLPILSCLWYFRCPYGKTKVNIVVKNKPIHRNTSKAERKKMFYYVCPTLAKVSKCIFFFEEN